MIYQALFRRVDEHGKPVGGRWRKTVMVRVMASSVDEAETIAKRHTPEGMSMFDISRESEDQTLVRNNVIKVVSS